MAAELAVLTVQEVAHCLRVSKNSAYRAVHRGEIPSRRVGKRLLVPIVAFERFLAGEPPVSETEENQHVAL